MIHTIIKHTLTIVICCAFAMLFGCNSKSFEYVNENEIPPGPGVFTGEKGAWTIYDSEAKKKKEAESDESLKEASADEHKTGQATGTESVTAVDDAEAQEFKEFQEWKKEQQDFEDFQEWKKTSQGSKEYQEFKEWQEWKAYKEWQESQKKTE